jgi:hypothetical protein
MQIEEQKKLLADGLEILESQGGSIDPRFLGTFEKSTVQVAKLRNIIFELKRTRSTPITWEKPSKSGFSQLGWGFNFENLKERPIFE